ncbi:MAG TPA: diacylglycerol kinase family protein [Caulobacteraceae bacterium]|jgi:diacylglycerol kinase family enzyme
MKRRIIAVLNRGGGGYKANCESELTDIVSGTGSLEVRSVEGADLAQALNHAATSADLVIVLGGDGTISLAASILGPAGTPMIALPGGTVNELVHRFYGKGDWRAALCETLAEPVTIKVAGGLAGKDLFLISAIFGMPSDWARAREALRKGRLAKAIELTLSGLDDAAEESLAYRSGGASGEARAVAVRCVGAWSAPPREPGLEAAALNARSLAAFVRLGADALTGEWRENPDITMLDAARLTLRRPGGLRAMIDGESRTLAPQAEIRFVSEAVQILAPRPRATSQKTR